MRHQKKKEELCLPPEKNHSLNTKYSYKHIEHVAYSINDMVIYIAYFYIKPNNGHVSV